MKSKSGYEILRRAGAYLRREGLDDDCAGQNILEAAEKQTLGHKIFTRKCQEARERDEWRRRRAENLRESLSAIGAELTSAHAAATGSQYYSVEKNGQTFSFRISDHYAGRVREADSIWVGGFDEIIAHLTAAK